MHAGPFPSSNFDKSLNHYMRDRENYAGQAVSNRSLHNAIWQSCCARRTVLFGGTRLDVVHEAWIDGLDGAATDR